MFLTALLVPILSLAAPQPPGATAEPWRMQGERMAAKAIDFLRAQQDKETGGWGVPPKGQQRPHMPAISGLVLRGMVMQPGVDAKDPAVAAGVKYILSFRKPDGGIYDAMLPSYNTAINLSLLSFIDTPEARAAIGPAQEFLKNLQWGTTNPMGVGGKGGKEAPETVPPEHAFYGGVGYGNNSRPDLSNLAFAVEAWHDSGLPTDDPAFQRAVVFLQRIQMVESFNGRRINEMPYAKGSRQGGFIYATAANARSIGQGQSMAGEIIETMDDGSKVSKLRAYGSMTYAGFKSYIYAGLKADDPRVLAAMDWISRNYTTLENPHVGSDGYYYFMVMFGRAMAARGQPTLPIAAPARLNATLLVSGLATDASEKSVTELIGAAAKVSAVVMLAGDANRPRSALVYCVDEPEADKASEVLGKAPGGLKVSRDAFITGPGTYPATRDWRQDIVESLARTQNPDGSFKSIDTRWMENDSTLITAYALIALQSALRPETARH